MEYLDLSRRRILYATGESLLTTEDACKRILNEQSLENIKVEDPEEVDLFDLIFGVDLKLPENAGHLLPPPHEHTTSDLERLEELICFSSRLPEDSDVYMKRAEMEFKYFVETKNVKFLLKVYDLIQTLKKDGVVWGIGRGSSCASLVFYLLFINDVDPVKWGIKFSELTKESDY